MIFDRNVILKGPGHFFKEAEDYMWIDVVKRQIVTTATISLSPLRAIGSPVYFAEMGGGIVEVRLPRSDNWITHSCRKEAKGVWWTIKDKDYFWEYVSANQLPEWAHDVFVKGVAQLEEKKDAGSDDIQDA